MNKTEIVYRGCRSFLHNHDHVLQNSLMFQWESDVFGLTKSGYSVEIEVKVSKSDFRADFKKQDKHYLLKHHKRENNVFSRTEKPSQYLIDETGKYMYKKHPYEFCSVKFSKTHNKIPNRFYYACPEGLISVDLIPDYAGLIYINDDGGFTTIKNAPLLHKFKKDWMSILFKKYQYRTINAKNELIMYASEISENYNTKDDIIENLKKKIKRAINILR